MAPTDRRHHLRSYASRGPIPPVDMTFGELHGLPLKALATRPVTEQFPDLNSGVVHLDAPAGTLAHAAVLDVLENYRKNSVGVPWHRSQVALNWAANRFRALIGAPGGAVSFGPDMTSLTQAFVRSIEPALLPGDEVVCTTLDHRSNVDPWRQAAHRRGAAVRMAEVSPDGRLTVDAVATQLGPRTRWIAVTAGSNALGTAPDLVGICAAARLAGAQVFVDGAQAPAHLPVDVAAWGCDVFVTSAATWYGPGCGILWRRGGRISATLLRGAAPTGGPGIEAILATGVAAEVLMHWDRASVFRHGERLANLLARSLRMIDGVRVLGRSGDAARLPIVAFQVADRPAAEVAAQLADGGVVVGHGTFGSEPALRAVTPETPEALRAGMARYTSRADVRALIAMLAGIAATRD
ncbi:aminotransferase class V-fold PLP-dependent enzyme [Verrucosispora sp. WMMD1129]|nr:aminotransferase class V-fold PLP-dependent enzyme [Verrucosispora sp. WMMD1129]